MPTDTIIAVTAIVVVFCVFGAVLAWGTRQTRSLSSDKRPSQHTTKTQRHADIVKTLAQSANSNDAAVAANERSLDKSAA
jgi:hypothetical protein